MGYVKFGKNRCVPPALFYGVLGGSIGAIMLILVIVIIVVCIKLKNKKKEELERYNYIVN